MLIDQILKSAIGNLYAQQECELKSILCDRLGVWTEEDLKRRCFIEIPTFGPRKNWEILYLDNKPILEMGPIEFSEPVLQGDHYAYSIHRQVRRL